MLDLIDTHCHLDIPEFDQQRDALLQRCFAEGMRAILIPGVVRADWDQLRTVCAASERLWPAFGMHPCYVAEHRPDHLAALESYLTPDVVAVGEIGLDAFHRTDDLEQQQHYFSAQVSIAKNHRLPLVIHSRKTHDLILKELRRQHFPYGGAVHAFSGSLQQAEKFIELGFVIGFGGGATYDRAQKLRGILHAIPLTNVVLETDSPDIPPCFARGEPNTPYNLFQITSILAEVLQIDPSGLAAQATQNALRVFKGQGATAQNLPS